MSYENQVSRPTYEQLLKDVRSFRDELAMMKRGYEDLFYNLEYDNFSSNLQKDMKKFLLTYKEVYPDGSTSESSISMTAEQIALAVSSEREYVTNLLGTYYYTREQMQSQLSITAANIQSTVSATYETKSDASSQYTALQSNITQTANSITSTVSATYETKSNAGTQYTALSTSISQTATSILSTVSATYATQTNVSQVKQTADKIEWLVASGTNSSNFTMTQRAINLVSSNINLTGYVTFNALSQAGQTTINGRNITTGEVSGDFIRGGTITGTALSGVSVDSYATTYPYQRVGLSSGTLNFYDVNTLRASIQTGGTWTIMSGNWSFVGSVDFSNATVNGLTAKWG